MPTPTFRVCVYQVTVAPEGERASRFQQDQLYEQTVEVLDLNRVIAAVNHKPRAPRKPRTPKP